MTWVDWMRVCAMFCAVMAALLAWRKTDGWGWFLFIAFILATYHA